MDSLDAWVRNGAAPATAAAVFDALPPLEVEDLLGVWEGTGLPTHHPLDGLLELYGWRGKRFHTAEAVDPLVFDAGKGSNAVNPARLPFGLIVSPRNSPEPR